MVDRKRIAVENHLARIRQDIRDNVAAKYACSPANHALGDATSPSSNDSDSNDGWIYTSGSNWCVVNVSICVSDAHDCITKQTHAELG